MSPEPLEERSRIPRTMRELERRCSFLPQEQKGQAEEKHKYYLLAQKKSVLRRSRLYQLTLPKSYKILHWTPKTQGNYKNWRLERLESRKSLKPVMELRVSCRSLQLEKLLELNCSLMRQMLKRLTQNKTLVLERRQAPLLRTMKKAVQRKSYCRPAKVPPQVRAPLPNRIPPAAAGGDE